MRSFKPNIARGVATGLHPHLDRCSVFAREDPPDGPASKVGDRVAIDGEDTVADAYACA